MRPRCQRSAGATGPAAVGVNGKHTPPFPCRMVEWSPELRYSVAELVDGLQLEVTSTGDPSGKQAAAQSGQGMAIRFGFARPKENAC